MADRKAERKGIPIQNFLQDQRTRNLVWQFAFFLLLVLLVFSAFNNVIKAIAERGMMPSFKFLSFTSGITVGETIIPFDSGSTNLRALFVGLLNTISISVLVIVFSTIFGFLVVLCRISSNWIVSNIAKVYIEIIRNIPLLMLLLVWYRAFFLQLPGIKSAIMLQKRVSEAGDTTASMILSNRGLYVAWPVPTDSFSVFRFILIGALIAGIGVYVFLALRFRRTGRKSPGLFFAVLTFLGISTIGFLCMGKQPPLVIQTPVLGKFNARGGLYVSSEWVSLFSGLVLYTSAFVAEALRAGIQGIPKGQMEASRALGIGYLRSLRLVIIPQAKIVAIPSLTSIFLGVAKNTSLGVAIGFPDLFSITGTIINQTGRALEMILIVMAIYLAMSGLTSVFMNWYNKKVQLIEG